MDDWSAAQNEPKPKRQRVMKKPAASLPRAMPSIAIMAITASWPSVLSVGSAFAGLGTSFFACRHDALRGFPLEHIWWAENNPQCQMFLRTNLPPMGEFNSVEDEAFLSAPPVDIFDFGFPCQPFSVNHEDKPGINDPRGILVFYCLLYIKRRLPRIVVMENVDGLLTLHPEVLIEIITVLKSFREPNGEAAYFVSYKVLNTCTHAGLPQNRPRLYIIAIRKFGRYINFKWPGRVDMAPITQMLNHTHQRLRSYEQFPMPSSGTTACRNIQNAIAKVSKIAEKEGRDPMSYTPILDAGSSRLNLNMSMSTTQPDEPIGTAPDLVPAPAPEPATEPKAEASGEADAGSAVKPPEPHPSVRTRCRVWIHPVVAFARGGLCSDCHHPHDDGNGAPHCACDCALHPGSLEDYFEHLEAGWYRCSCRLCGPPSPPWPKMAPRWL